MDIFDDYKYLFFMCGGVITTGGLFLFVMNVYNYNRLEKANRGKETEQNQNSVENQEQASGSEAQMELMDSEVKETNTALTQHSQLGSN